jgi:oligopeptide transport system permease protein
MTTENLPTSLNTCFWKDAWRRFCQNKSALIGSIILFFLIFMALLGPYFSSYTYYDIHLELKNQPPSWIFWFGTDELGRDVFTRTWWGARISLSVGIIAAGIDLLIGIIWGTTAAYFKGMTDEVMMRICDILNSVPNLLIVILLLVIMGPGFTTIIIALSVTGWINMARIIRSSALQVLESDFIQAAHSLGASKSRIIFRHLIPNTFGTIITTVTLTIPVAIFSEAFLSFLGLGIQAPVASWGVMVSDSLSALRYYPWRLFFPASMITLTMLGFNLFGDGLRDSLDPRLRK